MDFGEAINALKQGEKVARLGWNGKSMFIYLVHSQTIGYEKLRGEASKSLDATNNRNAGKRVTINSHIDMLAADGSIVVGWLASQTDMLAEDWEIVL